MRKAAVIGWLAVLGSRLLLIEFTSAGGKNANPTFISLVWFDGEDADPMLLGEGTNISPLGPGEPGCQPDFWLLPVVFI